MKPEIIFLSDNNNHGFIGAPRASAAYVLASQLKECGFRVQVIEYFTQHQNPLDLLRPFLSSELLYIGICSTFISVKKSQWRGYSIRSDELAKFYSGELWFEKGEHLRSWLKDLRSLLNSSSKNCKLVLGGTKAQFAIWRKEFYDEIDYVCLGPADKTLIQLAKDLKFKLTPKSKEFNGKKILDNSIDQANKNCPTINWTEDFFVQTNEALPLEVARGCLYNCKFCHHDKMESFRKTALDIKNELLSNYEKFGTDTYYLCDDCINDHRLKVETFHAAVTSLPFKIEWVGFARVDVAIKFPHTLEMLIDSGAKGLYFGLESFNYKVAQRAGKGTPTEKIKEFLYHFKENFYEKCLIGGAFIVGLPGETVESQTETGKWLLDNPVLDFINIGPLGLMPYVSAFDKLSIDYAEYSRNPEKFGFSEIDYKTHSWKHETFSSESAYQLATEIRRSWAEKHSHQWIRNVWLYPQMKSLGYTQEQIFHMVRSSNPSEVLGPCDFEKRFEKIRENYFKQLIASTCKFSSEKDLTF